MKYTILKLLIPALAAMLILNSCSRGSSLNRKSNVGAERLMNGKKVPRMKKFKS